MLFKKTRHLFWMDDPFILFKNDNYIKFVPTNEMTRIEQLNSITRFSIYFIILLIMFKKNVKWLYVPFFSIIITVFLYNIHESDANSKEKELNRILKIRDANQGIEKAYEDRVYNLNQEEKELFPKFKDDPNSHEFYTGYYDSDNNLHLGDSHKPPEYNKYNQKENLYSFDELEEHRKATCRKPTEDNPFMNPFSTDYMSGNIPQACNMDDDQIKENMELNFNKGLYRDFEDVWNRKNSQRQFFTLPSTSIPNNQKEFARWLYDTGPTCKEDGSNCLRYEFLDRKR